MSKSTDVGKNYSINVGDTFSLSAGKAIQLKVGKASITMTEDGKVNVGSGRPRLACTAILIKLSTSRKSSCASITLYCPYSAGIERVKRAAFAALAACATKARISQRML